MVSKVLTQEIFDNDLVIKEHFSDIPHSEKVYFHFYGMTLIALLTDLIIRRFGTHIIAKETADSNINQLRQRVF